MNWKHILSLSPDDLTDEEKDELYNVVAWLDCEKEKLDIKKCVVLIKLSQEIMKYKAEQVETLLAELDELATKQGEDDIKVGESEASRSKKSHSSMDYEELEEEYINMKNKLKKQIKLNDKTNKEMLAMKQIIANLERDKIALKNELQSVHHDTISQSDVSESTKDQYKELIDTVHQKNRQISDLLHDIEDVEAENVMLREKLSNVREELADGTKQITSISDELKSYKIKLDEQTELVENLVQEKEMLHSEVQDLLDQKQNNAKEVEEFTIEINYKIDELKKILDEKNEEIEELKLKAIRTSPADSENSFANEQSHLSALSKILSERDRQIVELQAQLENATKEMEESTIILNRNNDERKSDKEKIKELLSHVDDLKKQVKLGHERSQDLQQKVSHLEEVSEMKSKDFNELFDKLKDEGKIDLSDCLRQIEELKIQNKMKEKQICDFVKTCNKLENALDCLDSENVILREKLGIAQDDSVTYNSRPITRKRKEKKELQRLQKKLGDAEEELLESKSRLQKASRVISKLSHQVLELGGNPHIKPDLGMKQTDLPAENDSKESSLKKKMLALVTENEALRKGLHEILDSVNTKKEKTLREIKSDTLEKLLIALDVKHISGWYHPAMRLQAELHAVQGKNDELREQLRITCTELNKCKEQTATVDKYHTTSSDVPINITDENADIVSRLNEELKTILFKYKQDTEMNNNLKEKFEKIKQDYELAEQQIIHLYNEHANEIKSQTKTLKEAEEKCNLLEEQLCVADSKLNEYTAFVNLQGDELARAQHAAELSAKLTVLNRKCLYMENEESKLLKEIEYLKNELLNAENASVKKFTSLCSDKKSLVIDIKILENKLANSIDLQAFTELQNNFDNTVLKYKTALDDFGKMNADREDEIVLLTETTNMLRDENKELECRLVDVLAKLNVVVVLEETDAAVCELSKKLAQREVNEITQRQRADHTNNLYELIKEQLHKSEERFRDFEKYNKEILHKNLVLQENLKDLQDRINYYVDVETYQKLQNDHDKVLNENKQLQSVLNKIKGELKVFEETASVHKHWKSANDFELLSLKHQIVDLQAEADDKTVIARLSSDVVRARLAEADCQKKVECLMSELETSQHECDEYKKYVEDERRKNKLLVSQLNTKISALQELISRQRLQYFGCTPLTSQEKFIDNLKQVFADKHDAFVSLYNANKIKNEQCLLKEELKMKTVSLDELLISLKTGDKNIDNIIKWNEEKSCIQLKELKYRRELDFKSKQLEQLIERQRVQDQQIEKLEEELLFCYIKFAQPTNAVDQKSTENVGTETPIKSPDVVQKTKIIKSQEVQTIDMKIDAQIDEKFGTLQEELLKAHSEITVKGKDIEQLKLKITELEMNISLFKKQIGDKQSQINFYEKHILDMQSKKEQNFETRPVGDVGETEDIVDGAKTNEEIITLKLTISSLQNSIAERDEAILKYQSLLKEDRDEHSKAADRMQKELKSLQAVLIDQNKAYKELEATVKSEPHPSKAAIEHYFLQVHALEEDAAESRTKVTSLGSQLQACRQECVRWRALANDRLGTMEQLRKELESQHLDELLVYKTDSDKLQNEVSNLKEMIFKYKSELDRVGPDFNKILKEKDDKIRHLAVLLKQARTTKKSTSEKDNLPQKIAESEKEALLKELEVLKRRFDQLLNREKSARDEIRNLKSQLVKAPILSARSDKSDRTIKEQLQKKVAALENEMLELKQNLEKQVALNEIHKIKIAEDFDKWKKQKHWQQAAEKLKIKLKEKEEAFEKLQHSSTSFRLLIERLEREKHVLENRIRNLKIGNAPPQHNSQMSELKSENWRLQSELDSLMSKLELQQHHSGALGAAMLQDKLEAQERKIAILELSAKGTVEVRAEMERLQCTISGLQKNNLRLEAENLELRLDLEKFNSEVPHLKEQIQHLENYNEVLKIERSTSETGDKTAEPVLSADSKKYSELERTVFLLRRVIEKLQVENKRLLGGNKPCTLSDRSSASDRLRRELQRVKEQHEQSLLRVADLDKELSTANDKIKTLENRSTSSSLVNSLTEQLSEVRLELAQKSQLLDKVKVLLHRAATREKALLQEITRLKRLIPAAEKSSSESHTD